MQLQVKKEKMLLAGQWIHAEDSFPVYNPQNNQLIAKVPKASREDMLVAIDKAQVAFQRTRTWPTHERIRVLQEVAQYIKDNHDKFATTIAIESSKTINEARKEVDRAIQTIQISAEEARRLNGETINFDQRDGVGNRFGYYYRFPIGVIGAITPFNDPLNLVAHKVGPAIAAGNAVIVKPASVTPLSALLLAEAFIAAGLPAGLLSVIPGSGKEVGEALVTHKAVKMISFTGGTEAGEKIAHQAGLKKLSMELGSNCPVIVLKDADVTDAVQACISGAFSAVGQNCIGVQRIYIEKECYEAFLTAFKQRTEALIVGDKMDEETDIGPLINEKEAKRVESWVADALFEGATLQVGGKRRGSYYEPTVLTDVPEYTKIAQEEIFGPVVLLYPVDNLQEAIAKANNVHFGLQAGLFTSDIEKAFYAIRNLEVGGIMVNDSSDFRIDDMPFGGVKGSGLGREGVRFAIEEMTEPKVVGFRFRENV